MKAEIRSSRESGFVDLGMSLLIIALAGGVAYGVEKSQPEQIVENRQSVTSEEAVEVTSTEISASHTADAGTALQ